MAKFFGSDFYAEGVVQPSPGLHAQRATLGSEQGHTTTLKGLRRIFRALPPVDGTTRRAFQPDLLHILAVNQHVAALALE